MSAVLPVEGGLTVYEAQGLKDQWLAALGEEDAGAPLALDLSGVSEIDAAGVQLLLAARREAGLRGRRFVLTEASPAVREALSLLRVDMTIGD